MRKQRFGMLLGMTLMIGISALLITNSSAKTVRSGSSIEEWIASPLEALPAGVDTSLNHIAGNTERLNALLNELHRLETGSSTLPLAILQIGDSHTQAGFNTERTRTRLQGYFGDAGRGLISPLKLAGTNEPYDYLITSNNRWEASRCIESSPQEAPGITGLALKTSDRTIHFQITAKEEPFNRIRLFHHRNAPLLHAPDSLSGEFYCPLEDTEESTLVPLNRTLTTLTLEGTLADPRYADPVFYGFSLENGNRGVLYHSMGINGNTFTALNRNPQILRQAALLTPQLIILSLGTNDSYGRNFSTEALREQITQTLALCEQYLPGVPLLLTTPIECSLRGSRTLRSNPNAVKVRDLLVEAAEQHRLPYWDFWQIAGAERALSSWNAAGFVRADGIHLTREGYQLQGELLARALLKSYRDYLSAGLD